MPSLIQSFQGYDLGHLRIVATLWGVDIEAANAKSGGIWLAERILEGDLIADVIGSLPERALNGLAELLRNEGRLPWSGFTRRYGALREMGPARRDRERPYLGESASITEMLFYRGLVARSFFDTPAGTEEFVFIPDDLMELLPDVDWVDEPPLGRLASPGEKAYILAASDTILDDACTLLAALRLGMAVQDVERFIVTGSKSPFRLSPEDLLILLFSAGILDINKTPLPEPTRAFLEAPRGEALALLVRTWLQSKEFDDLRRMPDVLAEGEWKNDPLRARRAILDFLSTIPDVQVVEKAERERSFWGLYSFINAVKQDFPDFQREAGDYDSWHLRDRNSGHYLRGFENWDRVEGNLIRYIIAGPMHWLGILDLAAPAEPTGEEPVVITAFRYSTNAINLLDGLALPEKIEEKNTILVTSDGRIRVSAGISRAVRYQIARFTQWDDVKEGGYLYRVTPASLERARQQGLRLDHLLSLLRRHTKTLPPALVRSTQRWEANGTEVRLEQITVLRVRSPEILTELRASRASRYLGELLGPASVIVKPGAGEKVLQALAEMGYLGEVSI